MTAEAGPYVTGVSESHSNTEAEPSPVVSRDFLTIQERDVLRSEALSFGLEAVAKWLNVGRDTLVRLIGGLPVRRGSIAIVRQAIADRGARK